MKLKLCSAVAIIALSASGAFATSALTECSAGQLRNWSDTGTTTGGSTVTSSNTICYTSGSGNEVDCDRSGNLVAATTTITIVYPGFAIYQQPRGGDNQCTGEAVGEPIITTSCDISRTRGVGSTDFDYCDE
jgi:hypothetical protein